MSWNSQESQQIGRIAQSLDNLHDTIAAHAVESRRQHKELAQRVRKLESFRSRILGAAAAVSAGAGAASAKLTAIFSGPAPH